MSVAWRRLDVSGRLFESARWVARDGCFQWVDILEATAYRWRPGGLVETATFGSEFLSLLTPAQGHNIAADRDTLYRHVWGGPLEPVVTLPVGPHARLNDGIVAPDGAIWVGSMALSPGEHPALGRLWRVSPDGQVKRVLDNLGISNGIAWRDENHGYHVDSLHRRVDEMVWDGERVTRETILKIEAPGEPDGIVWQAGRLWVAIWDGAEVRWLNPLSGDSGVVVVPSPRPTSLAFSPDTILVTAAGQGSGSQLDSAGSVFVASAEEVLGA